jgi:gamma-glutamyltranspeptidase/glutathione hydrolase
MSKIDEFAGVRAPRSPVYGTRGMVVSGHSLASLAGLRVLEQGGSVTDAMIATSAVLCVVLPHATSLGGDAFIIHFDAKTGKTTGLNASGPAPAGATCEVFKDGMVAHGPLATTVPGIVRGWETLHGRYGRLAWGDLFGPAIKLARNGHPLSRVLANALILFHENVAKDPGCSAIYMPDGVALAAGDIVRQPALAQTLLNIAEGGSAAYYEGPIARSIGEYSQANGGLLSPRDFDGYAPEWVTTLSTGYRGLDVHVMPPNSFGYLMLMQLNGLAALPSEALAGDDVDRIAYLISATRAAFAAGQDYICDPRIHPVPTTELLSAETTAKLQASVQDTVPGPQRAHAAGGTSTITMADADGNGIAVVQSVFHVFGAAFMDPGTGVLLNNRMTGFVTDPNHRNVVAPGKRPAHTLNPVMAIKDGKIRYILSSPGGPAQTITNVQVLSNLVDRGLELSLAVDSPRWSLNSQGEALLEEEFDDDIVDGLHRRGHPVGRASGASYFGSAKCVELLPNGVLCGAADGRREGFAAGV